MSYATVVFDLDGTLVETRPGIEASIRHALRAMRVADPDEHQVRSLIGPPLAGGFRTVFGMGEERALEAVRHYRDYYGKQGMFQAEPYPGIPSMLAQLKDAGVNLLVATLKPAVYARQVLSHLQLLSYFDEVYGPDLSETQDIKAQLVLQATRAAPKPAAMVGDREGDLHGARFAGVAAIGVLYGYGSREELERCKPDALAKDAPELMRILRQEASMCS